MSHSKRSGRWSALLGLGVVALLAVSLSGCASYRVERQGKDVGKAICDLKNADNADQAQRAANKIQRNFQDAQRITGIPVNQDLRDISNQLSDLQKHVPNHNSALAQQDISVIQRNVSQVIGTTAGNTQRFYQGVSEGLQDCAPG